MYITLTSVTVKMNPVKRAKFWYWAFSCMIATESMTRYGQTTTLNGERLALTVWNDQHGIVDFMESGTPQKVMKNKVLNDVCTSSRFYSYETDRIPSWQEASKLLETKGQSYNLS